MKKKILILIAAVLGLMGCQRESMIRFSEENQKIINQKKAALTGESEDPKNESIEETVESDTVTSEVTSEELSEEKVTLDKSTWRPLEGSLDKEVSEFLPNQSYQIKEFTNGNQLKITYPNYLDQTHQIMQVESRIGRQLSLQFFNWGDQQLIQLSELNDEDPYINHIDKVASQYDPAHQLLLLEKPFEIGNSWQRDPEIKSEIVALYKEGQILDQTYQDIIEVKSTTPAGDLVEFYAAGHGLIASQINQETWVLKGNYPENRIIVDIDFFLPKVDDQAESLSLEKVDFKWQTNQSLSAAFQTLFREQKIIDETIQVQNVYEESGIAYLDFSPGVVAVLNDYPGSERAIITGIVASIGNFFKVDQVRLTVNNNGMLPLEVPYPTNGIYQVEEMKRQMQTEESNQTTTSTEESSS